MWPMRRILPFRCFCPPAIVIPKLFFNSSLMCESSSDEDLNAVTVGDANSSSTSSSRFRAFSPALSISLILGVCQRHFRDLLQQLNPERFPSLVSGILQV